MNALSAPKAASELVRALSQKFFRDPKLAYEAVAGVCHWPPCDGESLDDLIDAALDRMDELEDDIENGIHVPLLRMEILEAAKIAFQNLLDEKLWAEEAADDGLRFSNVIRMEG